MTTTAQLSQALDIWASLDMGSSVGTLRALLMIDAADGSMTQRELARTLRLSDAGVSRIASVLRAAGYVERAPDPADSRTLILRLTSAGAMLLNQMLDPQRSLD